MPKEEKVTNAELENRVTKVVDMLILGFPRSKIIQYVTSPDNGLRWNVSERQIDNYIAKANEEIEKHADTIRKQEFGKAKRRLELLFQSCMKVQDYQRALAVQRELNLLLGLHAPTKTEVTGADGGAIPLAIVKMPVDEL